MHRVHTGDAKTGGQVAVISLLRIQKYESQRDLVRPDRAGEERQNKEGEYATKLQSAWRRRMAYTYAKDLKQQKLCESRRTEMKTGMNVECEACASAGKKSADIRARFQKKAWRQTDELLFKGMSRIQVSDRGDNWNERWQEALALPNKTDMDKTYRKLSLEAVYADFVHTSVTYGRTIISEYFLHEYLKSVRPKQLGGVAGGKKYLWRGILFKLADGSQGPYGGSDEAAAKAAGHELRGASEYLRVGHGLCVPPMCLLDYKGFRMLAQAHVPVGPNSIKMGTPDGGRTVLNKSTRLDQAAKGAAKELGLRAHTVGGRLVWEPFLDGDSGLVKKRKRNLGGQILHTAADVEGHEGHDSRMYLLDLARAFPPEDPNATPHLSGMLSVSAKVIVRKEGQKDALATVSKAHTTLVDYDIMYPTGHMEPATPAHQLRDMRLFIFYRLLRPEFVRDRGRKLLTRVNLPKDYKFPRVVVTNPMMFAIKFGATATKSDQNAKKAAASENPEPEEKPAPPSASSRYATGGGGGGGSGGRSNLATKARAIMTSLATVRELSSYSAGDEGGGDDDPSEDAGKSPEENRGRDKKLEGRESSDKDDEAEDEPTSYLDASSQYTGGFDHARDETYDSADGTPDENGHGRPRGGSGDEEHAEWMRKAMECGIEFVDSGDKYYEGFRRSELEDDEEEMRLRGGIGYRPFVPGEHENVNNYEGHVEAVYTDAEERYAAGRVGSGIGRRDADADAASEVAKNGGAVASRETSKPALGDTAARASRGRDASTASDVTLRVSRSDRSERGPSVDCSPEARGGFVGTRTAKHGEAHHPEENPGSEDDEDELGQDDRYETFQERQESETTICRFSSAGVTDYKGFETDSFRSVVSSGTPRTRGHRSARGGDLWHSNATADAFGQHRQNSSRSHHGSSSNRGDVRAAGRDMGSGRYSPRTAAGRSDASLSFAGGLANEGGYDNFQPRGGPENSGVSSDMHRLDGGGDGDVEARGTLEGWGYDQFSARSLMSNTSWPSVGSSAARAWVRASEPENGMIAGFRVSEEAMSELTNGRGNGGGGGGASSSSAGRAAGSGAGAGEPAGSPEGYSKFVPHPVGAVGNGSSVAGLENVESGYGDGEQLRHDEEDPASSSTRALSKSGDAPRGDVGPDAEEAGPEGDDASDTADVEGLYDKFIPLAAEESMRSVASRGSPKERELEKNAAGSSGPSEDADDGDESLPSPGDYSIFRPIPEQRANPPEWQYPAEPSAPAERLPSPDRATPAVGASPPEACVPNTQASVRSVEAPQPASTETVKSPPPAAPPSAEVLPVEDAEAKKEEAKIEYTGIAGENPVPLSPDALTAFSNGDPEARERNKEITQATQYLLTVLVPAMAKLLCSKPPTTVAKLDMATVLHKYGINVRHIGLLRAYISTPPSQRQNPRAWTTSSDPVYVSAPAAVPSTSSNGDSESWQERWGEATETKRQSEAAGGEDLSGNAEASTRRGTGDGSGQGRSGGVEHWEDKNYSSEAIMRDRVLVEVVVRTLKLVLREFQRRWMRSEQSTSEQGMHMLVAEFLNLVTGQHARTQDFWREDVTVGVCQRFGTVALTDSERAGLWRACSKRPDLLFMILDKLVMVTGVRFKESVYRKLRKKKPKVMGFRFTASDIKDIDPVVTPMAIYSHY